MEEIVKALLEQNKELTQQIIELAKEALRSNVPAPIPAVPIAASPHWPNLSVSEHEEDARAMRAAGLINDEQLEDLLKEADFFSSEIVVPSPSGL